jgi:hypothetical protein
MPKYIDTSAYMALGCFPGFPRRQGYGRVEYFAVEQAQRAGVI